MAEHEKTDQELLQSLAAVLNRIRRAGMWLHQRRTPNEWDVRDATGTWCGSVTRGPDGGGEWKAFHLAAADQPKAKPRLKPKRYVVITEEDGLKLVCRDCHHEPTTFFGNHVVTTFSNSGYLDDLLIGHARMERMIERALQHERERHADDA